MNKQFQKHYEAVLDEAKAIRARKSNDYNLDAPSFPIFPSIDIPEYAPFGLMSIFGFVWAKCLRLLSLLRGQRLGEEYNESFDDTCIDLINYAAFMVAYRRMRSAGELDKEEAKRCAS